jgi:hypothetical protein
VAVWLRDPYPARDAEGARLNAAFVRFFKWLDE